MHYLNVLADTESVGYGFGTILFYILVGVCIIALAIGCFINGKAIYTKVRKKKKVKKEDEKSISNDSTNSDGSSSSDVR